MIPRTYSKSPQEYFPTYLAMALDQTAPRVKENLAWEGLGLALLVAEDAAYDIDFEGYDLPKKKSAWSSELPAHMYIRGNVRSISQSYLLRRILSNA